MDSDYDKTGPEAAVRPNVHLSAGGDGVEHHAIAINEKTAERLLAKEIGRTETERAQGHAVHIATLDLNDIGLDGIAVSLPLSADVIGLDGGYELIFYARFDDDTHGFDYVLRETGPDIAAALLALMTRFRREIENYDALPDDWLTPQGALLKKFYYDHFRPCTPEERAASKLQRRLDQADQRQIAGAARDELASARDQAQARVKAQGPDPALLARMASAPGSKPL